MNLCVEMSVPNVTPQGSKLIDFKISEEKFPSHFNDTNVVELAVDLRPNYDYSEYLTSVTAETKVFFDGNTCYIKYGCEYIMSFGEPYKIDMTNDDFVKVLSSLFKSSINGLIEKFDSLKTDSVFKYYFIPEKTDTELLALAKKMVTRTW